MSADRVALAARLRGQLAELELVVERAQRLLSKAERSDDEDYFDGVALNLHGFYTGVEHIFEDIAREIDESVPTGPEWHRDLLLQISVELNGRRPAVIQRQTRNCLGEYRNFRHVIRNIYAFDIRPARVRELAAMLPGCAASLTEDVMQFCTFLETDEENLQ